MYRIGEFSKLAVVPISLLRYYDKINLFKPSKIDQQSGYRLYAVEQLSNLYRILALRDLGIPLEDIADLVKREADVDELMYILSKREKEIEENIQAEQARLQRLRSRLDYLRKLKDKPEFEVIIKSVETQYFLAHRGTDINALCQVWQDYPRKDDSQQWLVITHSEYWDTENTDYEVGYVSQHTLPPEININDQHLLRTRALSALDMVASTLYTGHPHHAFKAYHALCKWIAPNGFEIIGPNREYFYEMSDTEIVLDIQFPIRAIDA